MAVQRRLGFDRDSKAIVCLCVFLRNTSLFQYGLMGRSRFSISASRSSASPLWKYTYSNTPQSFSSYTLSAVNISGVYGAQIMRTLGEKALHGGIFSLSYMDSKHTGLSDPAWF